MTKAQTKAVEAPKAFYGKVALLKDATSISKAIISVTSRGAKLDKDLHIIASSILMHIDQHGDITLANKLIEGMPKSARRNAMRDWMIAFGKVQWNEETKALSYAKGKVTLFDDSQLKPFFDFTPEKPYVPFDNAALKAGIASLLKKADNTEEKLDKATVDALRKLAA